MSATALHLCLECPQGLTALTNLRVLDLSNNRLSEISNVETLKLLEDLWLNDNNIESWHTMYEALEGPRQSLTTIYLENNPVVRCLLFFPNHPQSELKHFTGTTKFTSVNSICTQHCTFHNTSHLTCLCVLYSGTGSHVPKENAGGASKHDTAGRQCCQTPVDPVSVNAWMLFDAHASTL